MWSGHLNRLCRENCDKRRLASRHGVVGKVLVEAEVRHPIEPATRVRITTHSQTGDPGRSWNDPRPQPVPILHRYAKPRHQRTCVLAEALLPGHEGIAMMGIHHGALVHTTIVSYVV